MVNFDSCLKTSKIPRNIRKKEELNKISQTFVDVKNVEWERKNRSQKEVIKIEIFQKLALTKQKKYKQEPLSKSQSERAEELARVQQIKIRGGPLVDEMFQRVKETLGTKGQE